MLVDCDQRTLMKTIRQRQLDFFEHVMRRQGIEALVVTVSARFYMVQNKHTKRDAVLCAFVFVPNFPEYFFGQELTKLDDI